MKKILVSAIALMMVFALVMGVSAVAEEEAINPIVGYWTLDIDAILEQMAAAFDMTLDDLMAEMGNKAEAEIDALVASMKYDFIFNEDGTFVMAVAVEEQEETVEGTYTVDTGKKTITMIYNATPDQPEPVKESYTYDITGDKLTLLLGNEQLVFERVPANEEAEVPAA